MIGRWLGGGDLDRYVETLRGLDLADHLAAAPDVPGADSVCAWLTGQSSYRHALLSPGQAGTLGALSALGDRGWTPILGAFPFNRRMLGSEPYRPEPILRASVRNAAQWLATLDRHRARRGGSRFTAELARHLQPLLDAPRRRLLLLCGSCGLQLLAAALPDLEIPAGLEVQAVALGPVCWATVDHPSIEVTVVRGTRDWVSRVGSCFGALLGHRLPADLAPRVGHMDYAHHPETRRMLLDLAEGDGS